MTSFRSFIGARTGAGSLLVFIAMGSIASAQTTISWTTTSPTGDSGNWSNTALWTGGDIPDNLTGGTTPARNEIASFGAYANNRAITLDGNYSVYGLTIIPRDSTFNGKTFTLSGANTLTIGAGGFTIGGGNGTLSISSNLSLSADQTWTTAGETGVAATTISGTVSGSGKITRTANASNTSASIITFSGANTFSGGFTQNSALNTTRLGSSSTVAGGVITDGPLGTGTVTLNAGTLASSSGTARTISNNIIASGTINLGNSSQNGALTFSDAGLTSASTFTLGSATNGAVTVLRSGNTAITVDQVIAESGGTGQSVNFTSTSGTPTITINKTKTATGSILSGGVNLVLANGAANSGAIAAVNGSVTATGSNKFSSGALIADGANLIATDSTNFSAVSGGKASVYNNGRVSFATDQTQATVAGLLSSDSQVRLGLGSGSGSATVTQNYDQSALGNGKAGLVSASTGTMTYNGTLTAGSDGTYRVGGGAGTLAMGTALTGAGKTVSFEGGGTVTLSTDNTYTGTTTLSGTTVTISGSSGALSGTSGVAITNSSTLNLTNNTGAVNANRIADTAAISLSNSTLSLNGTSTGALTETVGNLIFDSGRSTVTVATTPGANTVKTLQFGTITRNNNALAIIRGDVLGSGTARNEIKVTSAPTLVGGGGAAGTTTISILPWARSLNASSGAPNTFLTYDTNGFRPLNTSTEFVQASNTTRVDDAITAAGGASNYNVRFTPPTAAGSTLLNTASASVTVNSFILDGTGATSGTTYTHGLNSGTINITSGALMIRSTPSSNMVVNGGTFAFGSAEGVVSVEATAAFLTTLGNNFTGSGGFSIYTQNASTVQLSGTNTVTGTFTFGGAGIIAVDQDGRFGNAANSVVHAGGTLQFYANTNSSRSLTLLGNVGNNTLANNTTSTTDVWTGNITGAGLLRLINNATTVGTGGFSLGGSNDYSGGTQIEGINVTGTTNNALGTGTVTLIGANNNSAALTLTGAAPALGGLRGTDGTVTLNPTAATATLTIGANNENTVFNGVIAQGAGKTASLTKTGTGTLVFGGTNTYTGTTTVSQGVLNLAVANSISSTSPVALGGGTLASSFNQTLGSLNVSASSILDLGTGGTFSFADSSAQSWTGALSIVGTFTDGSSVRFGTSAAGLTSGQLAQITINGFAASIDTSGYLVSAVPEPATYAALVGVCVLGLTVLRRRRHRA